MIDIASINCVGCTACASICPKSVIVMEKNDEGFFYPKIKKQNECIECGCCEKVCPVLNNQDEFPHKQEGLIAQNLDNEVRKESASGGLFSAIAKCILDDGGIVYGAAYNEKFEVVHIPIDNGEELWRLRNSKYVQSNINGIFRDIKEKLNSGKRVCFSGTPCQIEGLKRFLVKDYDNLLLVDITCHGVGSPLIWEKYLETVKTYGPAKIYFRWKHYGYKYSTMSIFNREGKEVYYSGVESDRMLRAYFTNNCDRESCYACPFKKRYRVSDLTMWDCFQPRIFSKEFDDDLGCSNCLIHSKKGLDLINQVIGKGLIKYQFVDAGEIIYGNNELTNSVHRGALRDVLFKDISLLDSEEFFDKYFPTSFKTRIKKMIRLTLVRTGLYKFFKYTLFKIRRKKRR